MGVAVCLVAIVVSGIAGRKKRRSCTARRGCGSGRARRVLLIARDSGRDLCRDYECLFCLWAARLQAVCDATRAGTADTRMAEAIFGSTFRRWSSCCGAASPLTSCGVRGCFCGIDRLASSSEQRARRERD